MKYIKYTFFCLLMLPVFAQEDEQVNSKIDASRNHFDSPDQYVEQIHATLKINEQAICPFGKAQDGGDAPHDRKVAPQQKVQQANAPTVLPQIVAGITVNAVMGSNRSFLSGSKILRHNQTFKVNYGAKSYELKVLSISADEIVFEEVGTDNVASKNLSFAPKRVKGEKGKEAFKKRFQPYLKSEDEAIHINN